MTNSQALNYLIQQLADTCDIQRIEQLLSALLTDSEQNEITNRLLIFALLRQGLPQREISERLGVGIATVSRGAKAYHQHAVPSLLPDVQQLG